MTDFNCFRKPDLIIQAKILDSQMKKPLDVGLHGLESAGNAKKSDGFFEKGILKALKSDPIMIPTLFKK
ncbi:uncharacterized protein LACBIDRAFT_313919 [Laccaria bicolor S238N-H82]|uniref:Predicted protein n=1 Tax=Laccaria bicolor (strain S238N-H82 / ATCC MYA-4686) TaxID=486041 RepID=B0D153_LACBS|nr:uncharacterized protein LACBIDRAFT_313919 [Laccaria bicolor S238N-H82]EDR11573.1 predicted protein [Laccaria bicolor S238N-H82]|eukprot:XP_001877470.1 predicted protein [Laccaria bicolor S238N-H82]